MTIHNTSRIEQLVSCYEPDLALVEGLVENPDLIVRDLQEYLGLSLRTNYVCTSVGAIKQALLYTNSIAALSRMMIEEELKQGTLALIPLEELRIQRSIRLIYHRQKYLSPAMKAFIQVLDDHIGQGQADDKGRDDTAQCTDHHPRDAAQLHPHLDKGKKQLPGHLMRSPFLPAAFCRSILRP